MIRDSRIAVSFVFGLVGGILILLVSLIYLPYLFSPYYEDRSSWAVTGSSSGSFPESSCSSDPRSLSSGRTRGSSGGS